MPTLPAHYFTLDNTLTDRAGTLAAGYHLVEDGEAFAVPQPPQSIAAPLSGGAAAIAFNGQNSFACLANVPAISGLGFWVCPETVDGAQVFLSRGVSFEDQITDFSIGHRDGRLRVTFGAEVWRAADRHFETGVWTHVALLFDGEAPQIIINGEPLMSSQVVRPRSSVIDTEVLASGEGVLLLAAEPAGKAMPNSATEAAAFGLRRFFDGSLDGIGLWNRDAAAEGLTAAAIRRLASGGPPDLIGLDDAPATPSATALPEPQKPQRANGHSVPGLARPSPASAQRTAEITSPVAEPTPPAPETATCRSDGPNDEIWNELKDLVTSINDDEATEDGAAILATNGADPATTVPDLSSGIDMALCEITEEAVAEAPDLPEPAEDVISADPAAPVVESATDTGIAKEEASPGLLSTLAELERNSDPAPEPEMAEQDAAVLLLTAAEVAEPAGFHGPPDVMYDSNAALTSALTEECAKAGNDSKDPTELEQEYGLDIPADATAAPTIEVDTEALENAATKHKHAAGTQQPGNDDDDLKQKLREALTAPDETTGGRSRFRIFGSRKKRDPSLPDLRNIRPHFGQKAGKPMQSETDGLPPIFSYKVSGAFADRVVDFGSPVRVKLVPDYGTTTPVPKAAAETAPPALRRRSARRLPNPATAAAFDELMDEQADELLFR